jgi:hypothetical protein
VRFLPRSDCQFCQFTSPARESNLASRCEHLCRGESKRRSWNVLRSCCFLGSVAADGSNRGRTDSDSRCTAGACTSWSSWSRPCAGICLGWRVSALDWQRLCVGGWKVGSSAACRRRLGFSPIRPKRQRLGVPQRILALASSAREVGCTWPSL